MWNQALIKMSTSVLKALPVKLDIKRHSPSILYLLTQRNESDLSRQSFQRITTLLLGDNCIQIFFSGGISLDIQELFHVYLNKFENAVTHLFLVIFGNN